MAALTCGDADAQRLIEANRNALGLIRSVRVEYENRKVEPGSSGDEVVETTKWLRAGDKERCWTSAPYLGKNGVGRPLDRREWALGPSEYRSLLNYDPEDPQPIRPTFQGTLKAEKGPRSSRNPTGANPARQLLIEMHLEPRRTLSDVAALATKVESMGRREIAGRTCEGLRLESPADPEPRVLEVWLDPQANFMVRRVVERRPQFQNADGTLGNTSLATAMEFKDYGGGIFLPQVVEFAGGPLEADPDALPAGWRLEVVASAVNEAIPDADFHLNFPKYSAVRDISRGEGKIGVEVWGDDGPLKRIESADEMFAFEQELMRDPQIKAQFEAATRFAQIPPPASFAWWPYVLVALLIGILAVPILLRARRSA